MSLQVLASRAHPRRVVDPFGRFPCRCDDVVVHITNSDSNGDDLVECPHCGIVVALHDLYAGLTLPVPG